MSTHWSSKIAGAIALILIGLAMGVLVLFVRPGVGLPCEVVLGGLFLIAFYFSFGHRP